MLDDDGVGYCSDITRCVHVGEPPAEVAEAYAVLHEAQRAAAAAAVVGTPCEDVDAAARRVIAEAGYGDRFIHRTGHGIGVEEHEDPYIVAGQRHAAGARATPSRSSRASTCPAASGCASRTSSSPPTPAPTRSTGPTTPSPSSTPDPPARMPRSEPRPTLARRDPPRRRHRAAAVGRRRPAVPVGHHPAARGRPRLRLAAARHLHADGRWGRSRSACGSTRCPCARRRRWRCAGGRGVALGVSVVRRKAGVAGERARVERRSAPGWRP